MYADSPPIIIGMGGEEALASVSESCPDARQFCDAGLYAQIRVDYCNHRIGDMAPLKAEQSDDR